MRNKTQNLLSKKWSVIGLVAILAVGLITGGIFTAGAFQSSTQSIQIEFQNGGYTAEVVNVINGATTWKYTIRDDETCDSSVFSGGSNLIDIVYNSNSYIPADEAERVEFTYKYICFSAANPFSNNQGWYGSKRLVWGRHTYSPVNGIPQPILNREPLISTEFPTIEKLVDRLELTDEAKLILKDVQIGFYYKIINGELRGDADCVRLAPEILSERLASNANAFTSYFTLAFDTHKRNICLYLGEAHDVYAAGLSPSILAAQWYHSGLPGLEHSNTWRDNNFEQYWLSKSHVLRDVVDGINIRLAHEIAHAIQFHFIYIEPDSTEVARIQALVNELRTNPPENFERFPDHSIVEWRWTDYEKRLNEWLGLSYEGAAQAYERELYAVVGTVIRNLPQELEEHYGQFFKNRTRVIRLFEWSNNGPRRACGRDFTLEECKIFYEKHFQEWDDWWGSDLL